LLLLVQLLLPPLLLTQLLLLWPLLLAVTAIVEAIPNQPRLQW
jgi:hypothetical protein